MSKIIFEINMDNDAMLKDPIGEVIRMIKLAVRKTELKEGCKLQDINGQTVGKLEVIKDNAKYSKADFKPGDIVCLTFMEDGKKLTLNDIEIQSMGDLSIHFETEEHHYIVDYKDIINASILGL